MRSILLHRALAFIAIVLVAATPACLSQESKQRFSFRDSTGKGHDEDKGVHVAILPKSNISRFVLRVPLNNDEHFILTKSPLQNAHESTYIAPREGESLFLAELRSPSMPVLQGEMLRRGNLALISLPVGSQIHDLFDDLDVEILPIPESESEHFAEESDLSLDLGSPSGESLPSIAIDKGFLNVKLAEFAGERNFEKEFYIAGKAYRRMPQRNTDTGKQIARLWLKNEFKKIGFVTSEHSFQDKLKQPGVNFIAEKKGSFYNKINKNSKFIVVSAHYDTVVGSPGADDNGSGVVGALAIAKALAKTTTKRGIRIVAFDQEELGLFGSSRYTESLYSQGIIEQVDMNINLDMIGYDLDQDGKFEVRDCNENTSAKITNRIKLVLQSTRSSLSLISACAGRSDHISFWGYGRPAVAVSEHAHPDIAGVIEPELNPCYHKSCDKTVNINYGYMAEIIRVATFTIVSLANRASP
jgi:hypothetical protein